MNPSWRQSFIPSVILALAVGPLAYTTLAEEVQPHPDRGLYAIWAKEDVLDLPFLTGGQVFLQWADVQPDESTYDFSKLDEQLARLHERGWPGTVQINGNLHPEFLFREVPYCPQALSVQVRDKQGTLQYWHPAYVKAYLDLVAAYGKHLRSSPYRENVLGVRLNFNAVGTEHLSIDRPQRDPAAWVHPPGVARAPAWSPEVAEAYKRRVVAAFIEHFTPGVRVFVRNNVFLDSRIDPELIEAFETGRLGLFHTSSEVEPRSRSTETRYQAFLTYGRPGKTLVYAEPWADAWGRHGGKTDARWCSPPQWNYWRLLVDLHCGVSFIAIYGSDLAHADEPEFRAALDFAAKYAGYHASPSVAPGAWVAMRQGSYLQGDYTFLMRRLEPDTTEPIANVGPADQRFGAWARRAPAGERVRFAVDRRFLRSLREQPATLCVVYLDEGSGSFTTAVAGREVATDLDGSGRWKTAEIPLEARALHEDESGAHITIRCEAPVTVHLVELLR